MKLSLKSRSSSRQRQAVEPHQFPTFVWMVGEKMDGIQRVGPLAGAQIFGRLSTYFHAHLSLIAASSCDCSICINYFTCDKSLFSFACWSPKPEVAALFFSPRSISVCGLHICIHISTCKADARVLSLCAARKPCRLLCGCMHLASSNVSFPPVSATLPCNNSSVNILYNSSLLKHTASVRGVITSSVSRQGGHRSSLHHLVFANGSPVCLCCVYSARRH